MSVYVDNARLHFRRMVMCHMVADSHGELQLMADLIGVQRKWLQKRGTYQEHYDVCLSMRKLAVKNGAIEITQKELGLKLLQRRGHARQ